MSSAINATGPGYVSDSESNHEHHIHMKEGREKKENFIKNKSMNGVQGRLNPRLRLPYLCLRLHLSLVPAWARALV